MSTPHLTCSVINLTRSTLPVLPYEKIARTVLGTPYELSVAFIGRKRSRKLNLTLRQKNKPANVLSLPLSKTSGEIILCLECIKKEAPKFGHSYKKHTAFLFIHGLLHLNGFDHGSTMEREEQKIMRAFF